MLPFSIMLVWFFLFIYFFLQYINSLTDLNGIARIGSFTMCCEAIIRLTVVSPNLLSASIRIIYDLFMSCRHDFGNISEKRKLWMSLINLSFQHFVWLQEMNVLIDEQSFPGLQSTTALLFQIKMRVCIVALPVTKGPPQNTNCSFWKVLLGYRPA